MRRDVEVILRAAAETDGRISFAGGLPADELFPRYSIAEAAEGAMAQNEVARSLQYGWPEGEPSVREWVAARLRARGADVGPDDVIVTSGAQQAMAIAARVLIRDGARVRVDKASYAGALDLFRKLKASLTTVLDERVTCAYVMPGIANPLGFDATAPIAGDLIALGCPIIADEAYAELRFDGRATVPLLARARDQVWHVGTVSKTLCPGLRVGWLVPPPSRVALVREEKQRDDLQAGALAQHVLAHVLERLDYDAHLERARRAYAERAAVMVNALEQFLPDLEFVAPHGGFSVFAVGRGDFSEIELLERGAHHGVVFDPGTMFVPRRRPHTVTMRLCFSNSSPDRIREGARRLAAAWDELALPPGHRPRARAASKRTTSRATSTPSS